MTVPATKHLFGCHAVLDGEIVDKEVVIAGGKMIQRVKSEVFGGLA